MDYGKKSKIEFTINLTSQISTTIVEPYNSILAKHAMIDHIWLIMEDLHI
jgi:tubulin alpha